MSVEVEKGCKMINKISVGSTYNMNNKNTTPSFQGGRWNVIKYAVNPKKKVDLDQMKCLLAINDDVIKQEIAQGIVNPIEKLNSPLKRHRAGFFARLANKFCVENFNSNRQDDTMLRKIVYNIYDFVKFPDKSHKALARSRNFNLQELFVLFKELNNDTKKTHLAAKLLGLKPVASKQKISLDEMMTILKSDYALDLNKNFKIYRKDLHNLVNKNPDVSLSELLRKYFDNLASK